MKTTLTHLPKHKQAELRQIVAALIPRFVEVEMIILFGSFARGTWVEDKYVENGHTLEYRSDYDLLIVLSKNGHANSDSLTHQIDTKLKELKLGTWVHPIYQGIEFVNQQLGEGNYFFGDIRKEGVLLFTTNRYRLAEKRDMSAKELQAIAQRDFDHWFTSANEFLIDFKNAFERESYNNAAFLLHQAAERYYGAIQLVFTAYKPKTHDLEVLGHLAKACDIEFCKVFPMATLEQRWRFELLRKAYVDARYNMDYTISADDLAYLSERVQVLRQLTESKCREKIAAFTTGG